MTFPNFWEKSYTSLCIFKPHKRDQEHTNEVLIKKGTTHGLLLDKTQNVMLFGR